MSMTHRRIARLIAACALTLSVGATAAAGPAAGRATAPAFTSFEARTKVCSVKGLRLERTSGSATRSVAVRELSARGTSCRRARHIAMVAARAEVRGASIQRRIDGYRITLDRPCQTCDPRIPVMATRSGAEVTFRLLRGT